MKNLHRSLFILPASIGILAASANAQVVWDGGGDGSTWGDDLNWVGDAEPTSTDEIDLGGATVAVDTADATYNTGGPANAGATININSGGTLTAVDGNFNTLRFLTAVNINDGGAYIDQNASTTLRTNMTVASGASLFGLDAVRDGKALSLSGLWQVGDAVDGNNSFGWAGPGTIDLLSGGTIELDLFANNTNEFFNVSNVSGVLNLNAGSIVLTTQGAYTPQIGDQFDLWDNPGLGTVNPGDGSNISLAGYTLDVSSYASDGVVTIVPEPSTYALLIGAAILGGACLRRRKR